MSERTGLDDFGSEHFRAVFEAWCTDLASPNLRPEGRGRLRRQMVHDLCRRLRVIDTIAREPTILDVVLPPIVWIVGPARSGSTLLHNVVHLHRDARAIQRWEFVEPVPPPEAATRHIDPRIAREEGRVDRSRGGALERMHWVEATDPEECGWGLYDCAGTMGNGPVRAMPTWGRHLEVGHDRRASFLEYRRLLQLLLWRCPVGPSGFLVLKAPQFTRHLGSLAEVFPEARFVITHRDPFRTLTSSAAILHVLAAELLAAAGPVDADPGRRSIIETVETIEAMTAFADTTSGTICHVRYPELLTDPAGVARTVLDAFGHDHDPGLDAAIDEFLAGQRTGRRAAPPATLPTFGYDHDEVWAEPKIAFYVAAIGLEPERQRVSDVAR